MNNLNALPDTLISLLNHQIRYMKRFVLSPRTFGSLAPSSTWLCNRMLRLADLDKAMVIAELGAGDGVLTQRLLKCLAPGAELDAYEIQPDMAGMLQQIADNDTRLTVLSQSAQQLVRNYDVIFSCLPLLSFPVLLRLQILRQVRARMNPGGCLIQFQYSRLSERFLSRYFRWSREYEVLNFPPAWVYYCTPLDENML